MNTTQTKYPIIITPHKFTMIKHCQDFKLNPRRVIWISNSQSLYKLRGLKLKRDDILLLHEWYTIEDVEEELDKVLREEL